MAIHIGRRKFITTLSGTAAIWPLAGGGCHALFAVFGFDHVVSGIGQEIT